MRMQPPPPPDMRHSWVVHEGGEGGWHERGAVAATDGAVLCPELSRLRSAGWAAVVVDAGGSLLASVHGTVPDPTPTPLLAELWAMRGLLESLSSPMPVAVDCLQVLRGLQQGRSWCTRPSRPHCQLWSCIWDRLHCMGCVQHDACVGFTFIKVRAHQPLQAIMQLDPPQRAAAMANAHADRLARCGAARPELEGERSRCMELRQLVMGVGRFLAAMRVAMHDASVASAGPAVHMPSRAARVWPPPRAVHAVARPHRLVFVSGTLRCRVCKRCAHTVMARRSLRQSECKGPALDAVVSGSARGRQDQPIPAAQAKGHVLACVGKYTFCVRCGCYTSKLVRRMAESCPRRPRNVQAGVVLRRLEAGLDPRSKESLQDVVRPLHAVACAEALD